MKSDIDLRRLFYKNVIVSGGSTMFYGFLNRLKKELDGMTPASIDVNVVDIPHRKFNVWIGGSILASLSTFRNMWVTKLEWEEFGAEIVHRSECDWVIRLCLVCIVFTDSYLLALCRVRLKWTGAMGSIRIWGRGSQSAVSRYLRPNGDSLIIGEWHCRLA